MLLNSICSSSVRNTCTRYDVAHSRTNAPDVRSRIATSAAGIALKPCTADIAQIVSVIMETRHRYSDFCFDFLRMTSLVIDLGWRQTTTNARRRDAAPILGSTKSNSAGNCPHSSFPCPGSGQVSLELMTINRPCGVFVSAHVQFVCSNHLRRPCRCYL